MWLLIGLPIVRLHVGLMPAALGVCRQSSYPLSTGYFSVWPSCLWPARRREEFLPATQERHQGHNGGGPAHWPGAHAVPQGADPPPIDNLRGGSRNFGWGGDLENSESITAALFSTLPIFSKSHYLQHLFSKLQYKLFHCFTRCIWMIMSH